MTIIRKDGYVFSVNRQKTEADYKLHSLCFCPGFRNYSVQIRRQLPSLAVFLDEFGVDIAKPDETMCAYENLSVEYIQADYTVCGKSGLWENMKLILMTTGM